MSISSGDSLTDSQAAAFFLSPDQPLQRQYEALRAFFVEEFPSAEAAQRFRYSPGAFRVLVHQFRHDPEKRSAFFRQIQRGPRSAPARDRVRESAVVVTLDKRAHNPFLVASGLADKPAPMPWFGNKKLLIRFA